MSLLRSVLLLTSLIAIVACNGGRKQEASAVSLMQTPDSVEREFSEADFLKEQQGTWVCYKYVKDKSGEEFDENYAKEFMKYAYFEISGNVLCTNEIYRMDLYAYRYSTHLSKYNDPSLYIAALNPKADSLTFIAPYDSYESYWETNTEIIPYYTDHPIIKTQLFWEDNFITYDRGYFFYFKKGTPEHDHIMIGMPGDERNYFKVEKLYKDTTMEKLLADLQTDFPYGYHEVVNDSNIEEHFFNDDWTKENEIRLEKSQSLGKFVITIRAEDNGFRVHYYNADDMDNGDEDYQG